MDPLADKKKEFQKLFLAGKHTHQQIADMLGISRITISIWAKNLPITAYLRVRKSLIKELDNLAKTPHGNEELIFQYIQHLDILDKLIRKAKYLPKI